MYSDILDGPLQFGLRLRPYAAVLFGLPYKTFLKEDNQLLMALYCSFVLYE